METTIFFSIISGLLLFIIGWLINLGIKIGKFDQFMIGIAERVTKCEERLTIIDKLNGILDRMDSRLNKLDSKTRGKK